MARRFGLCGRALSGRHERKASRGFHRSRIRHGFSPGPGGRRAGSRRRRLRRPDRLCIQLRRALLRVQQTGPNPRPEGPDERRPAHGRRPEEHRQGQPVRGLWRARHRDSEGSGRPLPVKVLGVDVFHPNTGEVHSEGAEGIACWFVDTDYNEESFFVRHAYFLGANDPYKALKTTLKAEINEDAWATLNSDTSRPFDKPKNRRIAVKVINHLGDEVMKVFKV